ncbi:alpha/beta fold hydrolase [Deferrisoma palaeochoriense]
MEPRLHFVRYLAPSGFRRLAVWEWGDPENPEVVVCVHGLTRTGRDFDPLARALARRYRVLCPDMPGRGRSDWLSGPAEYAYPVYLQALACLLARAEAGVVDWVGTSMGGLLGLMLAAQPGTPLRRLVLNDIGPKVPAPALERIASYAGADPRFGSLAEAEAYLRRVHAPFGPLPDGDWAELTRHSVRPVPGGGYALHYDPAIGAALGEGPFEDVELWDAWAAVHCPVLVVRGRESDVLPAEVATRMAERPGVEIVEFAGVGHAPALRSPDQIAAVGRWLGQTV